MSGHTPGPWTVNGVGGRYKPLARLIQHGTLISIQARRGDEIADARLIAAAPDLLALLREIAWDEDDIINCNPVRERIDAAIAKAEGK